MRHTERRSDPRSVPRGTVIIVIAAVWSVYIGLTLVRLQVSEHEWLLGHAEHEQSSTVGISPVRGLILDRNGREMARSVAVKSLYAAPSEIGSASVMADKLSKLLDVDRADVYRKLSSNQALVAVNRKQMVTIKRKLSDKEVAAIDALNAPGLHLVDEMKRVYVNGPVAAQVMGFVDIDEKGRGGIEFSYDKVIRGSEGKLLQTRDALKRAYDHETQLPTGGASVSLTIDTLLQTRVEEILKETIKSNGARGGTIIVTRPSTGEILAMADYPTFDPNDVSDSIEAGRLNRAVETAFEPGSVFKLVTYAAALNENEINPKSLIDVGAGEMVVAGHTVHDENRGVLTAAKALAKSSNIAAIKLGQRLGTKRLADYVNRFGFGKRTGVELPFESAGVLRNPKKWDESVLGSIPMGYGVGVTALQAVSAFGAIANGGESVKPFIVSQVTAQDGSILEQHNCERHRVVTQDTATTLKSMLEGVIMYGTGKRAKLGGYSAAGKTGTAHKIDPRTNRYSPNRYVASFVGFAPVENPQIACIVSIDEPKGNYYGGDVSAPVFARVASEALPMLGVDPKDEPNPGIFADELRSYQIPQVPAEPARDKVDAAIDAIPQTAADRSLPDDSHETPPMQPPPFQRTTVGERSITVPDLRGKGIREAAALCASQGLRIKVLGEGVVIGQNPAAGAIAEPGFVCQVSLSRNSDRKDKAGGVGLATSALVQ
jgi:cell division protein FtsI (penicillin-binding protein 3)